MSARKVLGGAEFRKEFESTLNSAQKSGILGFDPTDRAPNAIEWIIRREFLNSPRILNHWGQFQLVRDFFELLCPICAKESDIECWGKSKESLTSQPLLVWSKSWEEDMCWAPGTLVRTRDGHKKIEDVQLDDEVLTHEGRYRKVIDTKKNPNKNLLEFKSVGVPDLKCTDVHPFLILREEDVRNCRGSSKGKKPGCRPDGNNICKRCNKNVSYKPVWTEAKDINVGDYLLTKLDKSSETISVGTDKAKLLGLYLGDGHIIKKKLVLGNIRNKGFGITLEKSAKKHLQNILDVCKEIPTKNLPKVHDHKENALLVRVHDQELTKWLIEHAGHGSFGKRLNESIFNWHPEEKMALLGGYLDTDGCIDKDGKIRFATSNRGLALDIRRLILSLRTAANIRKQRVCGSYKSSNEFNYIIEISSGYSNFLTNFSVKGFNFDKAYKASHGFFFEDYFATPIKKKDSLIEEDFVYNLTVEEDESYHAEGVISHNCPKCHKTRSELEEMGDNGDLPNMALKFNKYNQLHGVIGMRCVPLNKIISTLNGLTTIGDLLTEEHYQNPGVGIPLNTHSVRTKDGISGITHLAYMGKKPISVTKFKSGFIDKTSVDHKYRVMDAGMNFSWKEAKDLKKGDVVVRRLGTRSYGPESVDPKFAYCIGALANSGYLERYNRINLKINKQQDNDLFVDKIVDLFKEVFGERRISLRLSKNLTIIEITGKDAIDKIGKFGLNLKFRENISEFPKVIYRHDKKTQLNFLKGFFDVAKDYSLKTPYKLENNYLKRKKAKVSIEVLNENQGKYKWPEVRFFCKNEEINRNIFIMMFNAGLLLTKNIAEEKMQTTVAKSAGWMYLSPAHVQRFVSEIGSLDDKFVSQCRYWHKLTSGPYRYIHHNFPLRLRKETGKFFKDFVNQFKGKTNTHRVVDHIHLNYKKTLSWSDWVSWLSNKGTIHPEFLLHGIDHLPSREFPAKLNEFLQEGNFYDMVMSTSEAPPEDVAEIRVAEHHSYIGDTFVYHNSGKSDVMGQIATYIEHDCLATAHDQGLMRYLGLPDDEYVDMSFVASSQDQADETVWAKYRNKRANSPWFQKYVPWVKHQESVQSTPMGMRKWRYIETESSITNEHPKVHIRINSWSTNSDSLVGKTRIGGVVDEMGRMKNTEGAGSAQEVYGGLESSCATVRGRVESRNLRNWLGFMLSMTSPKKSSGLEMQLLRVGQDIERMMTIHKATWEFNPLQPYSSLKDEFKKNPVKAWRDFGARPIDSEYPLIVDPKEFIKKTVAPQLKPTCRFEIFTEQEGPHRYTSARCTHADLDPNMHHFIAVDAGKNWDAFSMASAHPEYEENVDGSTKVLTVFDWILRIVPVEGTEVKFEFVEDVFRKLMQFQIIEMVRFDHWNSAHLIQKIRNMGVPDSMEENIKHEDYSKFVQDAKEGKVRMLPIPRADLNNQNQRTMTPEKIAFVELLELEKDPDTEKVFNPDKGKMRGWHCGVEGTDISKEFGLRTPIEQVKIGDRVIDKNGMTQVVEDHWCEGVPDEIVEIKTYGNRKLEFTANHKFPAFIWSRECQSGSGKSVKPGKLYASGHNGGRGKGNDGNVIISSKLGNKHSMRIPNGYDPIKKVRADELRVRDCLLIPRKFEEIQPNISIDHAYLLGIYIAEGWIYETSSSIQFGFNKNEDETLAQDTRNLLKKIADLDTTTTPSKSCNGITLFTVNDQGKKDSRSLIDWLIRNGGQYSDKKKLSQEVMKWPLDYKKEFIKGLFRGDGCQTLSKKDDHLRYRISLDLTSKDIIDQVELILAQLGIPCERQHVPFKNKKDSYRIRVSTPFYAKQLAEIIWGEESIFPSSKDYSLNNDSAFVDEDYIYIPIRSITIKQNSKPVYNMTISGDHSYLAEGVGTYNSNDTASVIVGAHKMVQTSFYVKDPFVRSNRNKRKAALAKRTVTPGMSLSSVYTPEK